MKHKESNNKLYLEICLRQKKKLSPLHCLDTSTSIATACVQWGEAYLDWGTHSDARTHTHARTGQQWVIVSSSSSTYRQGLTQQRSLIHNMVSRSETSALHYSGGTEWTGNSHMYGDKASGNGSVFPRHYEPKHPNLPTREKFSPRQTKELMSHFDNTGNSFVPKGKSKNKPRSPLPLPCPPHPRPSLFPSSVSLPLQLPLSPNTRPPSIVCLPVAL